MKEKRGKFLVIGHRGASNIAPENTMKAFRKAIELGADFIEFDVQLTKDGEIIIIHDLDVSRITGKEGLVKDLTLAELKNLDMGEGENIPTLDEVIQGMGGKTNFLLEIKVPGLVKVIIEKLKEASLIDSTIICSFLWDELKKVQEIEPRLKLATLAFGRQVKKALQVAIDNNYYAVHPHYKFIDETFIQKAHQNGLIVNPWTVDSKIAIGKLIDLGVDGIITNDIKRTLTIINEKR